MNKRKNTSPFPRLKFKKGDLIIKEGDYGISIYKIVEGKVQIFNESGDLDNVLATLGPGQVIGEMAFLEKGSEPRSASARAIEDTQLEVWHPEALSKEFEEMPPIIKQIIGQALSRLMRMNRLVIQLSEKKQQEEQMASQKGPEVSKRHFFRKEVDLPCICRPIGTSFKVPVSGRIRDISNSGAGVEVGATRLVNNVLEQSGEFHINTALPNGKDLSAIARVVYKRKSQTPGRILLGMEFAEISDDSRSSLGFFLRS